MKASMYFSVLALSLVVVLQHICLAQLLVHFLLVALVEILQICLGQENLSLYGNVSQSSTYQSNTTINGPLNAIEEPRSSVFVQGKPYCSITDDGEPYSWWKITFTQSVFISSVDLFYRENYASRMDGFRLSVTNDPCQVKTTDVCYQDVTDGTADIEQTVDCNKVGTVLLFDKYLSNNQVGHPFIELCYVGINGCFLGQWGPNCSNSCPSCLGGQCYPENGTCVLGYDECKYE